MEHEVLRKTFAEVGLFPWNKDIIRENCKKHCSSLPEVHQNCLVRKLLRLLTMVREQKADRFHQMMSNMKSVSVDVVQEVEEKSSSDKESEESFENEEQEESESEDESSTDIAPEPPAKRQRIISCSRKSCCIKGCENTHFWSKK